MCKVKVVSKFITLGESFRFILSIAEELHHDTVKVTVMFEGSRDFWPPVERASNSRMHEGNSTAGSQLRDAPSFREASGSQRGPTPLASMESRVPDKFASFSAEVTTAHTPICRQFLPNLPTTTQLSQRKSARPSHTCCLALNFRLVQ